MKRSLYGVLAVLSLLAVAGPAFAHHSQAAEFDTTKTVEIKGVVTKVDWINPHVFIYMDVKDAVGKTTQWSLQSFPTRFFHQSGIVTKETLMSYGNQEATATLNLAKDGSNYGWLIQLILPDGRYFSHSVGAAASGKVRRGAMSPAFQERYKAKEHKPMTYRLPVSAASTAAVLFVSIAAAGILLAPRAAEAQGDIVAVWKLRGSSGTQLRSRLPGYRTENRI